MVNIDKVLIDTNIWIYYLDSDSLLYKKSRNKIAELLDKDAELYTTNQIIREILVVLTHPNLIEKPLSPSEAVNKVREINEYFQVLFDTEQSKEELMKFIERYEIGGKKIHDANIVAVMKTNKIKIICTNNDKDFKRFKEIDVIKI